MKNINLFWVAKVIIATILLSSCGTSLMVDKISDSDRNTQKSLLTQANIDITKEDEQTGKVESLSGFTFSSLENESGEIMFFGKPVDFTSLSLYQFTGGSIFLPDKWTEISKNENIIQLEYSYMPEIKEEKEDIRSKTKERSDIRKKIKDEKSGPLNKEEEVEGETDQFGNSLKKKLEDKSNTEKYKKKSDTKEEVEQKPIPPKPYKAQCLATLINIGKIMSSMGLEKTAFSEELVFKFTKNQLANYNITWDVKEVNSLSNSDLNKINAKIAKYIVGYNNNEIYSNRFAIFLIIDKNFNDAIVMTFALYFPKFLELSSDEKSKQLRTIISCMKFFKWSEDLKQNEDVKDNTKVESKIEADKKTDNENSKKQPDLTPKTPEKDKVIDEKENTIEVKPLPNATSA